MRSAFVSKLIDVEQNRMESERVSECVDERKNDDYYCDEHY